MLYIYPPIMYMYKWKIDVVKQVAAVNKGVLGYPCIVSPVIYAAYPILDRSCIISAGDIGLTEDQVRESVFFSCCCLKFLPCDQRKLLLEAYEQGTNVETRQCPCINFLPS